MTGPVAVVMAGEEIEGFAGVPAIDGGFGQVGPGEGAVGLGLVAAVHLERVVGGGAAKAVALGADVAERAGIDQDRAAVGDELDAEGIGVAVTAAKAPWGPASMKSWERGAGHGVDTTYRRRASERGERTRRRGDTHNTASVIISEVWQAAGLGEGARASFIFSMVWSKDGGMGTALRAARSRANSKKSLA